MKLLSSLSTAKRAILALIIANTIWGAAAPIFKWSLEGIHPFTLAFFRFFIAMLIILPFTLKYLKIDKNDLMKVFWMSILGITINISFFFLALKDTVSINAPIIGSSGPIFVIMFSFFFLHEKISKKTVGGAVLGLIGVLLIVAKPLFGNGTDLAALGNLYLVIATLGGIGHLLIARKIMEKYNPLTITFYSFLIGSLTFLPMFLAETNGVLPDMNMQALTGVFFGAIFCSGIAYYFYHYSLKYTAASKAGLFAYLDPIVAIMIAIPLLGEIPTPTYLLGAALVFGGIYIAEGRLPYHPFHKLTNNNEALPQDKK